MSVLQFERGRRVAGYLGESEAAKHSIRCSATRIVEQLIQNLGRPLAQVPLPARGKCSNQPPRDQSLRTLLGVLHALLSEKICQRYRLKVPRITPSVPGGRVVAHHGLKKHAGLVVSDIRPAEPSEEDARIEDSLCASWGEHYSRRLDAGEQLALSREGHRQVSRSLSDGSGNVRVIRYAGQQLLRVAQRPETLIRCRHGKALTGWSSMPYGYRVESSTQAAGCCLKHPRGGLGPFHNLRSSKSANSLLRI